MSSDSSVPYIGSRISLISKSAIRYEGTLYTIDTNESTVALKDVRSFGSEKRPRPGGYIAPSPEVYEYIIFRGPDIAELNVISTPAVPSAVAVPEDDPAVVASVPKQTRQDERAQNSAGNEKESRSRSSPHVTRSWGPPPSAAMAAKAPSTMPVAAAPAMEPAAVPDASMAIAAQNARVGAREGTSLPAQGSRDVVEASSRNGGDRRSDPPQQRGTNESAGPRRRNRADHRAQNSGLSIPKEDFDFEAMNEKFDKASLKDSATLSAKAEDIEVKVEPRYNKSTSFFDNLEQPSRERSSASERRNADFETFGELNRHRGYGRGRGRGWGSGGGRGRGGGRGGRGDRGIRGRSGGDLQGTSRPEVPGSVNGSEPPAKGQSIGAA